VRSRKVVRYEFNAIPFRAAALPRPSQSALRMPAHPSPVRGRV
jgi:hypothetical protein